MPLWPSHVLPFCLPLVVAVFVFALFAFLPLPFLYFYFIYLLFVLLFFGSLFCCLSFSLPFCDLVLVSLPSFYLYLFGSTHSSFLLPSFLPFAFPLLPLPFYTFLPLFGSSSFAFPSSLFIFYYFLFCCACGVWLVHLFGSSPSLFVVGRILFCSCYFIYFIYYFTFCTLPLPCAHFCTPRLPFCHTALPFCCGCYLYPLFVPCPSAGSFILPFPSHLRALPLHTHTFLPRSSPYPFAHLHFPFYLPPCLAPFTPTPFLCPLGWLGTGGPGLGTLPACVPPYPLPLFPLTPLPGILPLTFAPFYPHTPTPPLPPLGLVILCYFLPVFISFAPFATHCTHCLHTFVTPCTCLPYPLLYLPHTAHLYLYMPWLPGSTVLLYTVPHTPSPLRPFTYTQFLFYPFTLPCTQQLYLTLPVPLHCTFFFLCTCHYILLYILYCNILWLPVCVHILCLYFLYIGWKSIHTALHIFVCLSFTHHTFTIPLLPHHSSCCILHTYVPACTQLYLYIPLRCRAYTHATTPCIATHLYTYVCCHSTFANFYRALPTLPFYFGSFCLPLPSLPSSSCLCLACLPLPLPCPLLPYLFICLVPYLFTF